MILYFSGTGNSRFVAEAIGSYLGDRDVIDLVPHIRSKRHKRFYSYTPYVFVAPIYAWRYPRILESFIRKSNFWGVDRFYFVATCESQTGNAGRVLEKICGEKGLTFCGFAGVAMPENYTVMYDAPTKDEARATVDKALEEILRICRTIEAGEKLDDSMDMRVLKHFTGLVNPLFYMTMVNTRKFCATDKCTGCGRCEIVCPFGSISLKDGRPVWADRCTHCMACINGCPARAIEFGSKTVGRGRYMNNMKARYIKD
ncbi:MAG: EFR1 family ferrodoxin [Ruminococcus sp.]|nr:EFR1 family ferrodoxin [Ruminococcus sp.]